MSKFKPNPDNVCKTSKTERRKKVGVISDKLHKWFGTPQPLVNTSHILEPLNGDCFVYYDCINREKHCHECYRIGLKPSFFVREEKLSE
jgi:hypothetical protein